jgi:hypothetical protein
MDRRTVLLAVGGLLGSGGLAGCLDEQSRGERSSPGSTTPAATDATETAVGYTEPQRDGTGTPSGTPTPSAREASNQPDPDLPIVLTNQHDAAHTITITVRQGGQTLHEAAYDLDPGDERRVYNLRETDPDGIESFTVEATLGDRTESVDVRTNACHGRIECWVSDGGEFQLTYSVG